MRLDTTKINTQEDIDHLAKNWRDYVWRDHIYKQTCIIDLGESVYVDELDRICDLDVHNRFFWHMGELNFIHSR